ncbi:MAG: hypothetical protein K2G63_03255 [Oscillospiraceae bacterium]|nr:hypothetical protein [Oscillospiraceae bacterium]
MKSVKLKIFSIIFLMISLNGCSFGTSIDNLLTPPKLSVEQEQIYKALTDTTGSSINLKYPKSGKYLSAFIIEDIDDDGENESIVFYEKKGLTVDENTLRINILDHFNDRWQSVCDTSAEGSEIEKVIISKLGENNRTNIIIGSSLINNSEKSASIYTYQDGIIEKTFSSVYSFMNVTDMDKDEMNEFLILHGSSSSPAVSSAYKLDTEGKYHEYKTELNGNFTEFDSLVYGNIGNDRTGLYIDAVSGSGLIQTDIIYMDSSGLKKVFKNPEDSIKTIRSSGLNTTDIDNDGIYEIPVQTKFIGYDDIPESEQIKMTEWYIYNGFELEKKYSGYYSISDGYMFIFPERWINHVTVRRDIINEELVFFKYSDDGIKGEELLRIYISHDSASENDHISSDYQLIHTKGETACMVYIPDSKDSSLKLDAGELALYFKFTE